MKREQLTLHLTGGDAAFKHPGFRRQDGRMFLVFLAPDAVAGQAKEIGSAYRIRYHLNCTLRPVETLHITLVPLGRFRSLSEAEAKSPGIIARLSTMTFEPIEVVLDEVMTFHTSRGLPLVLCCSRKSLALAALHDCLCDQFRVRSRSFTPHMTLAWGHSMLERQGLPKPVIWTALEPCLVYSFQGEGRYERLWPREGGADPPFVPARLPPAQFSLF